ncbi:MAG TPA: DUF4153 domain-containing protein [Croceibacterium sp.]|nr:DUF4153 domain-containing protein [Croceibacterium sp.]
MAGETIDSDSADSAVPDWPLRPWLLAGLLGFGGLLIHLVTHDHEVDAWRVAPAAFVFFGALAAAFTLEKGRWREPAVFAVVIGLVMAGLAWRAVRYGEHLPDEQYGFAAGVVATALALPLFQAGFLKRRFATPYSEIYHHIWTDAISAAGALAFTGLSWVALAILSKLFELLKIDFLRDLMEHGWFAWTFSGLAFGAALGVLRNELKVLGMLRTVVLLVLSLLAVPLAVGLVVFLLATAVSGPQVLWEATREATPTLLACAAGAFVLTCVLVRQDDEAMTRNPVMRVAALALAIVILPLAVFAAVSLGLRLNQYGLAPERLWGLVTVIVACAWGVGYWGALLRGRMKAWAQRVREANFMLAVASCGMALFLALPILDFGRISAGNQLHRLESGKVSPDQFDFAALRWDFGDAGRRALTRLAANRNKGISERARIALAQTERPIPGYDRTVRTAEQFQLKVQPDDAELRQLVLAYLETNPSQCEGICVALELDRTTDGRRKVALLGGRTLYGYPTLLLGAGKKAEIESVKPIQERRLNADARIEIRSISEKYVFIDGQPIGNPIK